MSSHMPSSASYGVGGGAPPSSGFHESSNGGFATSATKISRKELDAVFRQIKSSGLFNKQLQFICQVNGLKSSGVKADLQRRISDRKYLSSTSSSWFTMLSLHASVLCTTARFIPVAAPFHSGD